MHFYNLIKGLSVSNNIKLFIDMDGVIVNYDLGRPFDFINKRPLKTNINVLKKVAEIKNVDLCILSICKKNNQIDEKNTWLDRYAPFFKKENRYILSKEEIKGMSSSDLKLNFLKNYKTDYKKVLVDDDNKILKRISNNSNDIILYQDSELID